MMLRHEYVFIRAIVLPFILIVSLNTASYSAANLTVTPSQVHPEYLGSVTVTCEIRPAGTARLDIVPDFDRDGKVDSQEIPFRSFNIKDNEPYKIGNTIFPWVPSDLDSLRGGYIEVRFPLYGQREFVGYSVIRVDDGSGAAQKTLRMEQPETGITVQGKVYQNGNPNDTIPAVLVVDDEDGDYDYGVIAWTDQNGNYEISLPREGQYSIIAFNPEGLPTMADGGGFVFTRQRGDTEPVNLNLITDSQRIHYIRGRVVDSQDERVPYVRIVGMGQVEGDSQKLSQDDDDDHGAMSTVLCDEDGEFALKVIDGTWNLMVTDTRELGFVNTEEFKTGLTDIRVNGKDIFNQTLVHPLKIDALITGRILDGSKAPPATIPAVLPLEVFQEDEHGDWLYESNAAVNPENGEFVLGVAGNSDPWFVQLKLQPGWEELGLVFPDRIEIDPLSSGQVFDLGDLILLPPAATMYLYALDEDGTPLADVGFYVNYEGQWQHPNSGWVETDSTGRAIYQAPEEGSYSVGPGFQSYEDNPFLISPPGRMVEVAEESVLSETFTMITGGLIEGSILGDNGPVTNASIVVYPEDPIDEYDRVEWRELWYWNDLPQGIDYWVPLPPGKYHVLVDDADDGEGERKYAPEYYQDKYALSQADTITIAEKETRIRADFSLTRGGKISGLFQVIRPGSETPQPTGPARVILRNADSGELVAETTAYWEGHHTEQPGTFLAHVPAGDYKVEFGLALGGWLFETGYYTGEGQPLSKDISSAEVINLSLDETETINVTVQAMNWVPGDITGDNLIGYEDLMFFSIIWQGKATASMEAFRANLAGYNNINEEDLLRWCQYAK